MAKKWLTDKNIALIVLVKEAEGIKVPTEKELLDILKKSRDIKHEAYVDKSYDEPLISSKPKAVKVVSKTENKELPGFMTADEIIED